MICALELIRRDSNGELGDEPFSIGLWVGSASSPNTFAKAQQLVESAAQGSQKAVSALVIDRCPWCDHAFQAPTNYQVGHTRFHFVCTGSDCSFAAEGEGLLPCNVVDEALYRQPPTLLIATIDKFARLAWDERAGCLFGAGGNRPPELVVQDELHLVAGHWARLLVYTKPVWRRYWCSGDSPQVCCLNRDHPHGRASGLQTLWQRRLGVSSAGYRLR